MLGVSVIGLVYNLQEPSAYNLVSGRFPLATAVRTARLGLYSGLAFGILQDALSLARGRGVGYVDFLSGKSRHRGDTENRII